jgi:hypothetical protein
MPVALNTASLSRIWVPFTSSALMSAPMQPCAWLANEAESVAAAAQRRGRIER